MTATKLATMAAILLLVSACGSKSPSISVNELQDTSAVGTIYSFPVLETTPVKIGEKINQVLQQSELQLTIGEEDSSIFERIWPQPDEPNLGTVEMGYYIYKNSKSVLSVRIFSEVCAAYCEVNARYYNFDLSTGEPIELTSIFSDQGLKMLSRVVISDWQKVVSDAISQADNSEDAEALKNLYKDCFNYINDESVFAYGFNLSTEGIHIHGPRCSSHMLRALDEIGDLETVIPINEFQQYLSESGKKLLSN